MKAAQYYKYAAMKFVGHIERVMFIEDYEPYVKGVTDASVVCTLLWFVSAARVALNWHFTIPELPVPVVQLITPVTDPQQTIITILLIYSDAL